MAPGRLCQQLGHIGIDIAQAKRHIQAVQRQRFVGLGESLVLPAALVAQLVQIGLHAILAQRQVFAQAGQQANCFSRVSMRSVLGESTSNSRHGWRRSYGDSLSFGWQLSSRSGY